MWITFYYIGGGIVYTNYMYINNFFISKVFKTGGSLNIVIPHSFIKGYGIQRGDIMVFSIGQGDVILMRKITDVELLQLKPPIVSIT